MGKEKQDTKHEKLVEEMTTEVMAAFARANKDGDKKLSPGEFSSASKADQNILSVLRHYGSTRVGDVTPQNVSSLLSEMSEMVFDNVDVQTAEGKTVHAQANANPKEGRDSDRFKQKTIDVKDVDGDGKTSNAEFLADGGYEKLKAALKQLEEELAKEPSSVPATAVNAEASKASQKPEL